MTVLSQPDPRINQRQDMPACHSRFLRHHFECHTSRSLRVSVEKVPLETTAAGIVKA